MIISSNATFWARSFSTRSVVCWNGTLRSSSPWISSNGSASSEASGLCWYQFDLDLATERPRGAIKRGESDRRVFGIEQSMNRRARCMHLGGHRTLVEPFLFHQIIKVHSDRALQSRRMHFLVQAFFVEKAPEAASAMFVLSFCCF